MQYHFVSVYCLRLHGNDKNANDVQNESFSVRCVSCLRVNTKNAISHDVTQYGGNSKSDVCLGFIHSIVNLDFSPPTKLLIHVHHSFYLLSDEEENRMKSWDSL